MLNDFLSAIEEKTKKTVTIKINNNKSSYLVLKYCKNSIFLSLHNFFLKAPSDVLNALLSYIITKKKEDFYPVRKFIYSSQCGLDFSNQIEKDKLITKGNYFDLGTEYKNVNKTYFNNDYDLNITWFNPTYKTFRYITFGSYDRQYKLIRINKKLDHKAVSIAYIRYLIFHEMLHEVYPSKILKNGRCQMHSKAFKDHERSFPEFSQMKKFEEYFIKNIWRKSGRA